MDDATANRDTEDIQHRPRDTTKAPSKQVKNHLRSEREQRGWSRDYVATKIGSDAQSIGRWERGTTSPSPYYRQALCELFRMNAKELGFLKEELQEPLEEEKRAELPAVESRREALPIEETSPFGAYIERERLGQPMFSFYHPHPQASLALHYRWLLGLIALGVTVTLLCALGFMIVAERILPVSLSFIANTQSDVKPGGLWVLPINGQRVGGTLSFAAKAYPTNSGDPPINHVNFTLSWQNGGWRIGCVAYLPTSDTIYTCTVILTSLHAPPGNLRISFDVYDQQGNINFAPNGIHTVVYAP